MTTPRERDESIERWLQSMQAGDSPATGACIDGATVAAWVDGGLSDPELALVQAHVAVCARCQSLVATLARTDAVSTGAVADTESSWRRWFGWVVPLTAAATALIALAVWLRAPEPPERPSTMAVAREDREATPPAPQALPPDAPAPFATPPQPSGASPAAVPPAGAAPQPAAPPPAGPLPRTAETARAPADPSGNAAPRQGFSAADNSTAAVASEPAAKAEERSTAARESGSGLRDAAAEPTREIVAPDGATRWRISGAGVELSLDGGRTWSPASTGSAAALAAGSAPSASVCWLVGDAGTVLRTSDRATWTRIPFPEPVNLVSIRATDARSATVTTADGRTFATADGATWRLVPGP